MFITAAHAQAAEATQAAVKAGDWYLTLGVLGVTVVVLLLAVGFLFWKLDRLSTSIMREVITALQANTAATTAGNVALTALKTTLEGDRRRRRESCRTRPSSQLRRSLTRQPAH